MKLPTDKDFVYEMSPMKLASWPVGTWPLQEYNFLSGLRSVVALVLLVLLLFTLIVEACLDHGSAEKNLDIILMLSCCVLAISKVGWFRFRCRGLVANFVSAVKDHQELKEEEKRAIMRHHAHMGRNMSVSILCATYCTVAVAALITSLPQFAVEEDETENLNQTIYKCKHSLPLPTECTLELLELPENLYSVVSIAEFLMTVLMACGNLGSDTMFFGIMFHLCGQVEVLKLDFSRFLEDGADSTKRFNALVNRHCHLLTLAEDLHDTIGSVLVLQLSSSCFLICLTGVQFILSLQMKNFAMVIKAFMVVNIMLCQLYAYSYVGEYSKNQFEGIGYLAYCSDWYNAPCNLSRNIIFILMKSEYPVQLKAGNYFPINLQTYMSILKTSMSYLSVLRVMVTIINRRTQHANTRECTERRCVDYGRTIHRSFARVANMTRHANKDFSYAMGAVRIFSWPVGTWPLQKYNFVSGIRCFVSVTLLLVMLTVVHTEMYLDVSDAEKNMDAVMLITCFILAACKVTWFRIRSKGLVVNFLSALKDYDELANLEKKVIVRRHAQMGRVICGTFMLSTYIACTLMSMVPMLVREDKSAVENLSVAHRVSLNYPVPSDCTLDLLNLPASLYPVIYIAEYIMLLMASIGNFGSDSMFHSIIFHLCGQAEVLKLEFRQCFEVGEKKARFYTLIARHQQLLKLSKYLNDTINPIMIVQLFSSSLLICTCGFQFIRSLSTNNIVILVKTTTVVAAIMAQLFVYSYVLEYLKTQFEGVGYCVYCSKWFNIPRKLSLDMVFFLMRSQKPVLLKAGNFIFINLETFMSILKTSMSYLSVLRVMVV
ncbi:uncharacterized protein LOC143258931 [Megalopta genalis]|uniref:uncharacterized protein LOC143258931 n=1 Tax=Megalopta genalis TaxID=115081 RepID=UPI003FD16421